MRFGITVLGLSFALAGCTVHHHHHMVRDGHHATVEKEIVVHGGKGGHHGASPCSGGCSAHDGKAYGGKSQKGHHGKAHGGKSQKGHHGKAHGGKSHKGHHGKAHGGMHMPQQFLDYHDVMAASVHTDNPRARRIIACGTAKSLVNSAASLGKTPPADAAAKAEWTQAVKELKSETEALDRTCKAKGDIGVALDAVKAAFMKLAMVVKGPESGPGKHGVRNHPL